MHYTKARAVEGAKPWSRDYAHCTLELPSAYTGTHTHTHNQWFTLFIISQVTCTCTAHFKYLCAPRINTIRILVQNMHAWPSPLEKLVGPRPIFSL